ncbi:hypothetical protein WA158_001717 [Blastocystis sp. Blastoise]
MSQAEPTVFETDNVPTPSIKKFFDIPHEEIETSGLSRSKNVKTVFDKNSIEAPLPLYTRLVDAKDYLSDLKRLYENETQAPNKWPTLMKDIEDLEKQIDSLSEQIVYKGFVNPKIDMPASKSFQKLTSSKIKSAIKTMNKTYEQPEAKSCDSVHYNIYYSNKETQLLSQEELSSIITQLETSLGKTLPELLTNDSILYRIEELEKKLESMNEIQIRNTKLLLNTLMNEVNTFQRLLNQKAEGTMKPVQQILTDIENINKLYNNINNIMSIQILIDDLNKKISLVKQYYQENSSFTKHITEIKSNENTLIDLLNTQKQSLQTIQTKMDNSLNQIIKNIEEIDSLLIDVM